jgi:hypothetical protein
MDVTCMHDLLQLGKWSLVVFRSRLRDFARPREGFGHTEPPL